MNNLTEAKDYLDLKFKCKTISDQAYKCLNDVLKDYEKMIDLIGWFAMRHGPDSFNGYDLHEMASHVSETSHPTEYDYAVAFVKILEESKKEVDE